MEVNEDQAKEEDDDNEYDTSTDTPPSEDIPIEHNESPTIITPVALELCVASGDTATREHNLSLTKHSQDVSEAKPTCTPPSPKSAEQQSVRRKRGRPRKMHTIGRSAKRDEKELFRTPNKLTQRPVDTVEISSTSNGEQQRVTQSATTGSRRVLAKRVPNSGVRSDAQDKKKPRRATVGGPFMCDVCNKTFSSRSNMCTHRRVQHAVKQPAKQNTKRPFTCATCGKGNREIHVDSDPEYVQSSTTHAICVSMNAFTRAIDRTYAPCAAVHSNSRHSC
jgi:hypothetical protein